MVEAIIIGDKALKQLLKAYIKITAVGRKDLLKLRAPNGGVDGWGLKAKTPSA